MQLSASHGMEALGALLPAGEVSLRVPLQVLRENESPALELSFSGEVFQLCHLPGVSAASPGTRLVWHPWLAAGHRAVTSASSLVFV